MIVITGASASGKTETARVLKTLFGISKVVTHTTRPIRFGERDGVDYHFVTRERFLELRSQDFFVETTEYNGNFYGTSKSEIADNKVLIVETSGARVFLGLNNAKIVVFRLLASKKKRYSRMLERGDSLESIQQRLDQDVTWFADSQFNDSHIINIDTEDLTLEQVANRIYMDYQERLFELKQAADNNDLVKSN